MLPTIKHQDANVYVVIAKLLTGYNKVASPISDPESYVSVNSIFNAEFVSFVLSFQGKHGLTEDGVIGPATWSAMAQAAPTCSTSKNRTSGYTMALQLLIGGNITADAVYGPRTKAAVVTYQDSKGLSADGICGPKTWAALITGDAQPQPEPGKFVQPKDFKQGAKPWGPKMYSNHGDKKQTMATSGCGPTSMADIVYTLKDNSIDPYTLAELSMGWGDRTYNSGTSWTFFKHIAEYYHFTKFVQSSSIDALKACLDAGGYVVASMGPGYWTSGGHFITPWKYDANYIYCNDPASTTRKKQKIADFKKQSKQYFCFYPDEDNAGGGSDGPDRTDSRRTVGTDPAAQSLNDVVYTINAVRGDKIVDISKWQPTVNYDALVEDTALIILRAGYRGTGGSVKADECFRQHANELTKRGVRFGVYFYSIASTEAKASEEAKCFWEYAQGYDPLFWAGDFEDKSITHRAIQTFADELRRQGCTKVGAYVANHLYKSYDFGSIADEFDFVWIPKYTKDPPVFKCDLWQFTSSGSVNGISGRVDMNRITGQGHDLAWFTGGDAT